MQLILAWWRWTIAPLCIGGSSKSQSQQTTNNVDRRIVADAGAVAINADASNVTVTDHGAVQSAIDLVHSSTLETLGFTKDIFAAGLTVLDKAGKQVESQTAVLAKAYDNAQGEGAQKNMVAAAAIAAVVIVAVKVWSK